MKQEYVFCELCGTFIMPCEGEYINGKWYCDLCALSIKQQEPFELKEK